MFRKRVFARPFRSDARHLSRNVKTAKLGPTVAIPIVPMLMEELEFRVRNGSPYAFPESAANNETTPLELVQKRTGRKTADIVMKRYFQSGREAFRDALQSAMSQRLPERSEKTHRERRTETIDAMNESTYKEGRQRRRRMIEQLCD